MRTIEADERAVRATLALIATVTSDDLSRPTPCSEWDLGALLSHMTAQHRGFAAAATGRGADPSVWQVHPFTSSAYASAAEQVITAFAGAPGVPFVLPEVAGGRPVPASTAIGFHLVDYVVHGWDVARSLGVPFELPAEVVAEALPVARAVPGGSSRLAPGAAFAPARSLPHHSDPLTEIISRLGRSAQWTVAENVGGGR
jgi:uncharacterized protein (TIGR03086 family)